VTRFLLWLTVALLPLLVPRGPGNTAPVDLFAAGFLVLALLALARSARPLEVPAWPALALILIGSLVALALSDHPRVGLLTLLVDMYLLLLLVVIPNHLQLDAPGVRAVLVVWTVAALAWTAVLLGAHYRVLPQALGELLQLKPDAKRASGPTGNNPNLAGSYLVASFFVLVASPWPRRRPFRMLAGGWLLLGEVATGSLGGLLGLGLGIAVLATGAYLRAGHTAEQVRALLGAALLAGSMLVAGLLVVAGPPRLGLTDVQAVSRRAQGGPFDQTVGRAGKTLAGRLGLWSEAMARAGTRALVGVGPGEAKAQLQIASGSVNRNGVLTVHSLHNDYLAFLVERGILGLSGLLLLYGALLRRAAWVVGTGRRQGIRAAALAAGVVAIIAGSLFHEVFHFRHAIVLFALLWVAADLVTAEEPAPEPPEDVHALG
jgi:O-antigen ligase